MSLEFIIEKIYKKPVKTIHNMNNKEIKFFCKYFANELRFNSINWNLEDLRDRKKIRYIYQKLKLENIKRLYFADKRLDLLNKLSIEYLNITQIASLSKATMGLDTKIAIFIKAKQ